MRLQGGHFHLSGKSCHHRGQIAGVVADVEGRNASVLRCCKYKCKTSPSQQMHGDSVPAEGIDVENIEILVFSAIQFLLERQPPVARNDIDVRGAVGNEAEETVRPYNRQMNDFGVDFVIPDEVAGLAIRGHRPNAQLYNTNAKIRSFISPGVICEP